MPFLATHPVRTLSVAYILIDGGRVTTVESVTQTRPLPRDKPELVAAHVAAARMIGMAAVFLDCGSGARDPVPAESIQAVRGVAPEAPLFVGGGITAPEQAAAARVAGADYVVVGTSFERSGLRGMREFAAAVGA
jgi:putative glycerol-1-phosphate prenyltransferase